MTELRGGRRYRGYAIRDLAVGLALMLVAAGLVIPLAGANRDLSQATVCTSNLETLFGGLMAYVNTYNSFPPHHPYPTYGASFDPSIGWIMTHGLAMTPPSTYGNGHFKWFPLNPDELPSVCVCPAADYDRLFTPNEEIDDNNPESFTFQYAAFYQTSGSCRAATPVLRPPSQSLPGLGGRNPTVPNPSFPPAYSVQNSLVGSAYVWATSASGVERICSIQAVHPSEVDNPSRVYYMADSRDYRPEANGWPGAAICDGWMCGYGNKTYMSTRHYSYANVMYLDGQVNRDGQDHPIPRWNLAYSDASLGTGWRCGTFSDPLTIANLGTQHHIMPVLNVVTWEEFFNGDGIAAQ